MINTANCWEKDDCIYMLKIYVTAFYCVIFVLNIWEIAKPMLSNFWTNCMKDNMNMLGSKSLIGYLVEESEINKVSKN